MKVFFFSLLFILLTTVLIQQIVYRLFHIRLSVMSLAICAIGALLIGLMLPLDSMGLNGFAGAIGVFLAFSLAAAGMLVYWEEKKNSQAVAEGSDPAEPLADWEERILGTTELESLMDTAFDFREQGHHDRALLAFRRLITLYPDDSAVLVAAAQIAAIYRKRCDDKSAIEELTEALSLPGIQKDEQALREISSAIDYLKSDKSYC